MAYTLLGSNISYSLSPKIYGYFMNLYQIESSYSITDIHLPSLNENFINNMVKNNIKGFNVTKPFKELMLNYLDELSDEVKCINAVNMVSIQNSKLIGYNTDYLGLLDSFFHYNLDIVNKKILILGAGGASKSLIYALKNKNNSFSIINRNINNAVKVQLLFNKENIKVINTFDDNNYDIIFNATTLDINSVISMYNIALNSKSIVYDLNYYYNNDDFKKYCNKLDVIFIDGLFMLMYQAVHNFNIWFGIKPQIDDNLINLLK
jgi:shikimate dehydrogenase